MARGATGTGTGVQRDFLDRLRIEHFNGSPNLRLCYLVTVADQRVDSQLAHGHGLPTRKIWY